MYCIIKANGKQFKVKEGDELLLTGITQKPKAKIDFPEVLLLKTPKTVKVGKPLVSGASVKAEVLEHLKGKKIRVAKFRSKSRYRRVQGYRDSLTRVKILRILTREKKAQVKPKK